MRLGNVKARLGSVRRKAWKRESKARKREAPKVILEVQQGKASAAVFVWSSRNSGRKSEHQPLRRSWLEDNRFKKCIERKWLLLGLAELESIAERPSLKMIDLGNASSKKEPLTRPGRAREHSGRIKSEGFDSEEADFGLKEWR